MISENMTSPTINYQQDKMLDIESSISKLLQTTKKLLKDLTSWSSGEVNDTQVYDDYNALENYFASAAQAFESVLLPMDDMMDLPDELYQCLKNITSQEPSPKTLESYLPSIRDIILKLLQGLKMKQKTLRERFEPSQKSPSPLKERFDPPPPRTSSPLKEVPSPLNLKLPYQKRISVPQTPISPLSSLEHHTQTDKQDSIDIYLKMENRTKKLNVNKSELTLDELYRLFYDSFLSTSRDKKNDIIYILDYHTKVEYELDDINDIQPYSVLILKDITALDNQSSELKQLIESTIIKVLHNNNIPPKQTNEQYDQPSEKDLEELLSLKQDLSNLKQVYARLKQEISTMVADIREKEKHLKKDIVVVIDNKLHQEMDEKRKLTQKAATLITNRLENLQDKIDQLKTDVTQRRCRPSKLQLDSCQEELGFIKKELDTLSQSIKKVKPTWKKTWEVELQQIVKEQQFLKEQEALLVDLNDDHVALADVLDQLVKIHEINERKKKTQPQSITTVDEDFEGMKTVLKQLSCIQIDHTKRVKALQEAEKLRSKELSQRIDAFERELTDFVELKKLKNIGGTEAIEKMRQEKDKEMIKDIMKS